MKTLREQGIRELDKVDDFIYFLIMTCATAIGVEYVDERICIAWKPSDSVNFEHTRHMNRISLSTSKGWIYIDYDEIEHMKIETTKEGYLLSIRYKYGHDVSLDITSTRSES